MTEKEFRENIEIRKEMELLFRTTKYVVNYGIDNQGRPYIGFGEENLPVKKYYSYGELVTEAELNSSPLRYAVESLVLLNG